jgi:hypothetical protein
MGISEIISHCELMVSCGDVIEIEKHRYMATDGTGFERIIHA